MKRKTKFSSWLPIFSGFYENPFWEENLEYEAEHLRDEYGYKGEGDYRNELWRFFDYTKWHLDLARDMCRGVVVLMSTWIKEIKFEELKSPREYNFDTDAVNCIITPKKKAIRDYIYLHKEKFEEYLRDNYTSRDGFSSFYSNDFDFWKSETNDFRDWNHKHYLGSVLRFIALNEKIGEENLYYEVRGDGGFSESMYWKDELFDQIDGIWKFVRQEYQNPERLSLMHERFDSQQFDFDLIIQKVDHEIESKTLEIPFVIKKKK